MTVVAQYDRPKLVRNRCVIERFVASLCYFDYALYVVYVYLSYDGVRSLPFSLKKKWKDPGIGDYHLKYFFSNIIPWTKIYLILIFLRMKDIIARMTATCPFSNLRQNTALPIDRNVLCMLVTRTGYSSNWARLDLKLKMQDWTFWLTFLSCMSRSRTIYKKIRLLIQVVGSPHKMLTSILPTYCRLENCREF